jgi:hypothetical protein
MASAGFIPTGGGLVGVDMWTTNEEGKQKRLRVSSEAMHWLVKKMAQQGTQAQQTDELPLSQQAAIGRGMTDNVQPIPAR